MRLDLDLLLRLLFVFYCVEAGIFLAWAPWTPFWERSLAGLPFSPVTTLMLDPLARGAVTGFGLVHLVWGAHDLDTLLTARGMRRAKLSP